MKDEYLERLKNSDLFFYGPTKGSFILPPNGYFVWKSIQNYLDEKFFNLGIKNVYLPSIIPIELIEKEKKHIDGFSPEFFYVKKGQNENDHDFCKLILRPTSEVIFHYWYKKFLMNYKQLPLLFNQWCSVFRFEKNTYPFFRNNEFLWQEGHTLHENENEAREFVLKILDIYKKYFQDFLSLNIIFGKKSEKEKFAGAIESYSIEFILSNGYFLQLATVHFFSNFFCKSMDVNFQNDQNKIEIPFSTSWGSSTRSIGALADFHHDNKGILFPSELSPIQISIIPIKNEEKIEIFCDRIFKSLLKYRLKIYRNYKRNFSSRIYDSAKDGCLLNILVGEKELKENFLTLLDRFGNKSTFFFKNDISLENFFEKKLNEIDKIIHFNGKKNYYDHFFVEKNIDSLRERIKKLENNGKKSAVFLIFFCNEINCENNISNLIPFYSVRCIIGDEKNKEERCIFCGKEWSIKSYFGKSY